jgi:hypothetical protein
VTGGGIDRPAAEADSARIGAYRRSTVGTGGEAGREGGLEQTMRKYIRPGSVRIEGLLGLENGCSVRDNGSGQLWSGSEKVGSINYWTGSVILDKRCLPKVGLWDRLLLALGLKSIRLLPNIRSEYEVTDLDDRADVGAVSEPSVTALTYRLATAGPYHAAQPQPQILPDPKPAPVADRKPGSGSAKHTLLSATRRSVLMADSEAIRRKRESLGH